MIHVVTLAPGVRIDGPSIIAIGAFDGVHRGHQALLGKAASDAHHQGLQAVAVTFDVDPEIVLTPATASAQLLTLDQACEFIGETGIDTVLVVPFTPELATHDACRFLDETLGSALNVSAIHVGRDFRFGARAAGDVGTLQAWGDSHGAAVCPHELVSHDGSPVSATRIRSLVAAGSVDEAAGLLGRPHLVTGDVVRGRGEGRGLGFPTANLSPVLYAALPADGAYAAWAILEDRSIHRAAVSVGLPPMFPDAREHLEVHIPDFDGDLYGSRMTVAFGRRLRGLRRFESLDALIAAISSDVESVRSLQAIPDGLEHYVSMP